MSSRVWQAIIIGISIYTVVNFARMAIALPMGSGTFGFTLGSSLPRSGTATVKSVAPQLPAQKAGIKPGDSIDFDATPRSLTILTNTEIGDHLQVRDGSRTIDLVAERDPSNFPLTIFISFAVTKFSFWAIALLLILRKPGDPSARALSLFLACFGAGIITYTAMIHAPEARLFVLVVTQMLFMTGSIAFLAFTTYFPAPAHAGARYAMRRALPLAAAVGELTAGSSIVLGFTPQLASFAVARTASFGYAAIYLLFTACAIGSLWMSYVQSGAGERARMRWIVGIFAVGFSGIVALFVALLAQRSEQIFQYLALTIIVIPFGLAYVILRHRMLDITFVVNRAVVYTSVSLIIVGTFIIFEWLLSHVVEENSRASVVLQLGGALALGLSTRFVHARVDRFVDDLFFRDRHLAEQAIRRFAHEAPLVTDAGVLVKRTVEVAERNARLEGAAFYVRRDERYVPLASSLASRAELSENDEAVLDMRAWHQPVHRASFASTQLPGEDAFPMMVRGQLSGFLVCGSKRSHEALAPDERDALRVLARDAGIALDSLRVAGIEAELARLTSLLPPHERGATGGGTVTF